jgi:hypothetical protein
MLESSLEDLHSTLALSLLSSWVTIRRMSLLVFHTTRLGSKGKSFAQCIIFFGCRILFSFRAKARRGACFFSNDQFLLTSLIIWKKVLIFSSVICADWHMFSGSWKDGFNREEC